MTPTRKINTLNSTVVLLSFVQIAAAVLDLFQIHRQGYWQAWAALSVRLGPVLIAIPILILATAKYHSNPGFWRPITLAVYILLVATQALCGAGAFVVIPEELRDWRLLAVVAMLLTALLSVAGIYLVFRTKSTASTNIDLESALKQAYGRPASAVSPVLHQLYISKIFVPLKSATTAKLPDGSTRLQLRCWENNGAVTVPVYTTLHSLQRHLPNSPFAELLARDLFPILPKGASLFLEPHKPYGLGLSSAVLTSIFDRPIEGPYKSQTQVMEIEGISFGTPAGDFSQFYVDFSRALSLCKTVKAAYLVLTVDKNSSDPPNLFIMLHSEGKPIDELDDLMSPHKTFADSHGWRMAIVMLKPESAVGKFVLETFQPFYDSATYALAPQ